MSDSLEWCSRVLPADPFRADGLKLLTALEADGWAVRFNRWTISDRAVAVYEVAPPAAVLSSPTR